MKTDPNIKVYLENLPHLCIKKEEFFGFQAYIEYGDGCNYVKDPYRIDIHSKDGAVIKCEYTEKKTWIEVLDKLNKETIS